MNMILNIAIMYWKNFVSGFVGVILGTIFILLLIKGKKKIKASINLNERPIVFSKIALGLIFVIMVVIVLVSFFVSDSKFSITNGMIYILALMIFIVFSDSIEDFSVANIVSLKKNVKEKEKEVHKLSSENTELRTQLTSIVSASIHNQNLNNVVLGFGDSFLKYAHVEQVTKEDDPNEPVSESPADTDVSGEERDEAIDRHTSTYLRIQFFRRTEQLMLNKFAALDEIPTENVRTNVRFANYLDSSDPIMEYRAVFDGYLKRPLEEVFIISSHVIPSINTYYRLYYMISLILQYAKSNKKSAKLVLLTPSIPDNIQSQLYSGVHGRNIYRELERLRANFQPAIRNGFLEIVAIDFSEEECNTIIDDIRARQNN